MTPRDRERGYLMHLLTDRDAAQEVRAMGLPGYLRGRWDRLYDARHRGAARRDAAAAALVAPRGADRRARRRRHARGR